jgi:hypothetical protein
MMNRHEKSDPATCAKRFAVERHRQRGIDSNGDDCSIRLAGHGVVSPLRHGNRNDQVTAVNLLSASGFAQRRGARSNICERRHRLHTSQWAAPGNR